MSGLLGGGGIDGTELEFARAVIYDTYGDKVSVSGKLKPLLKFGRNPAVPTTGATLMGLLGSETEETYVERNLITTVSAANASDTNLIMTIEGHTSGDDISVSSITQTGGTATLTTVVAHELLEDCWINIEGANQAGYNGIVQIQSVPSSTTLTYNVPSGTSSPATGTITVNNTEKTFVTQNVTLQGQTQVTLGTPLSRATRAFIPSQDRAFELNGDVYIYEDDTATAGVPDTDSKCHLICESGSGLNQSEKAATCLSNEDYWIISRFRGTLLEKAAAFADVALQIREPGGIFRQVEDISAADRPLEFKPYLIVPKNSDVRLYALSSGASIDVSGSIQGYLAVVT